VWLVISFSSITFKSHVRCVPERVQIISLQFSHNVVVDKVLVVHKVLVSIAFKNHMFGVLQEGTNSFAPVTRTKV
jgi:hypothetical protein